MTGKEALRRLFFVLESSGMPGKRLSAVQNNMNGVFCSVRVKDTYNIE